MAIINAPGAMDNAMGYSYFGARYYDSDLSVWLSVDPMSDKYPHQSPYMYCSGSPVMRIDPNGMWDDEFGFNASGELVYYKQKAGPDEVYRMDDNGNKMDVNGDGKMTEGTDYVTFDKSTVNVSPVKYNDGTTGKNVYEFKNQGDAKKIFKFFSDNTVVEAGLDILKRGNEEMAVLFTGNNPSSVTDWNQWLVNKYLKNEGWDVVEDYHNHPDNNSDYSGAAPTRYNYSGSGDQGAWHSIAMESPEAKFFIYTKGGGYRQHMINYPPEYYQSLKNR